MLLSSDERKRRCEIIKQGIGGQFWLVLKDSLVYLSSIKLGEMSKALSDGKIEEAKRLAIEKELLDRIIAEPEFILSSNKDLFESTVKIGVSIRESVKRKIEKLRGG